VALLEERHGLGFVDSELPDWLERRLVAALQALLAARGGDLSALLQQLKQEPDLVVELANAVCVGKARFYRDAAQWEGLRRHFLPGLWTRSSEPSVRVVRALSAGCSTGEEAWTLAMLLGATAPGRLGERRFEVLGLDGSPPAVATARSATYDASSADFLPPDLAQRFLVPAVDGSLRVVPELQSQVSFTCHDLTLGVPPGPYALVVCKNVLTHLSRSAQARLVSDLLRSLTPDGLLLVARSEVPLLLALGTPTQQIPPDITVFHP
jgi:chemotaxis methyl-accepting protein methylase